MPNTRASGFLPRAAFASLCALTFASTANMSAHVVRGLDAPALATAFVSSPTSAADAPIAIKWGAADSTLRVVCYSVANTSPDRMEQPGWPRITMAGFELPGDGSGFSLVEPLDGRWELVEGVRVRVSEHDVVTLDFAVTARRTRGSGPRGIPPGQAAARGSGARFCVSGPFPDEITPGQPTTIEQIINGVVVGFRGVEGSGRDTGIWDNAARVIPLFPE